MSKTLALCMFTHNRSKEKALVIIIEDIGFALCYDVEQSGTVLNEFRNISPTDRGEYQRQVDLWISGKNFPEKRDRAPTRVIAQDFGGEALSNPLMAFASSDDGEDEVTDPEFQLPKNPKKLN